MNTIVLNKTTNNDFREKLKDTNREYDLENVKDMTSVLQHKLLTIVCKCSRISSYIEYLGIKVMHSNQHLSETYEHQVKFAVDYLVDNLEKYYNTVNKSVTKQEWEGNYRMEFNKAIDIINKM